MRCKSCGLSTCYVDSNFKDLFAEEMKIGRLSMTATEKRNKFIEVMEQKYLIGNGRGVVTRSMVNGAASGIRGRPRSCFFEHAMSCFEDNDEIEDIYVPYRLLPTVSFREIKLSHGSLFMANRLEVKSLSQVVDK